MASKASILAIMDSNRARLGFGRDKSFVPTPNARNPPMMTEAEAFSVHLRDFENSVRDYHQKVQGFLRNLLPILDDNLPRVWLSVDEASGLAEPVRAEISHGHPSRVGGDYDATELHRHLDRLDRGVQEDVLLPLKRWQEGLVVARERMHALERLRREVDGQRRKAEKRFSRAEAKLRKAYLGAGYGSSSSSSSDDDDIVPKGRLMEDYHRLALHTERQLRALMESYEDQERLVWEQLSGLVTDAAWFESYAAATMLKVKEAFQGVALALGPSKQPLPAYRSSSFSTGTAGRVKYGDVGDNVELIAQMSPRADELAHGSVPRAAQVLPYQPLRAKRGLATPLLVAAAPGSSQRRLAQEPVPPVNVGASAVPMHALPEPVVDRALREVDARITGPEGSSGVAVPGLAHSPMGASPHHAARSHLAHGTSPTVTTPTSMAPSMVQRSTTTPTTGPAGVHAVSHGLRPGSAGDRPRDSQVSGYTSTLSPREEVSGHRGVAAAAAAAPEGAMRGESSSNIRFQSAAAEEPVSEVVRAAAATGSQGDSPVPFGHLTRDREAETEHEGYRTRPRGFGSTTLVEGEGLGLGKGIESSRGAPPAQRTDNVLDSYATPVKEAAGGTMGGTMGSTMGGTLGGTTGLEGSAAPLQGADMAAARGVNGTTPEAGRMLGGVPSANDTGTGTTLFSEPTSYAISNISSQAGSPPATPGGSSVTDAIRAEIARHGPVPAATAVPTNTPYSPAAVDARTADVASPGGGCAPGLRGTASDTVRPLGSEDGSEQFVDANSEMSSRAGSIASGREPGGQATAAPWGPGQPSAMAQPASGLSKQQQQQSAPFTGAIVQ